MDFMITAQIGGSVNGQDFPGGSASKNSACSAGDTGSMPGKTPSRSEWQPTLGFLPGESYRQRSLAGSTPWCRKETDTTEWLRT